ncbi:MATE family efflux transporter [Psychromonas sp. MME2]|uniref:MATE family efflux transporter n=1 Tax=unclassified Psychromonas TaxID=2614957 RepID=UPI00339BCC6E
MFHRQEINKLIKLSVPLFIAQFAQTAMGFVDTVMAGGVSANDMAAVAVASSIWLPCILFGVGILMALIPRIAQAHGANETDSIPYIGQQGLYLALFLSVPTIVVLYNVNHMLNAMDIDIALKEIISHYIFVVLPAVPAFLLFQALRNYVEGLSLTKPAMVIAFIGLLLNIPLNWIFVYGKFGLPALGGVGCGVATTIVYWFMLLSLIVYVFICKKLKYYPLFTQFKRPNGTALWSIFKLGLPVAIALFFEITIFAMVAILVAPLGPNIVAAHQIAINFSSMVFMLPLSIANAVSIRVGFNLGKGNPNDAKQSSYAGFTLALGTAICTALLTVYFREDIAYLYTDDLNVIPLALTLILFAALYQCTDAIQVVAAGALRGYQEMKAIFIRTFIAYWLVGLPLGYLLGLTNFMVEPMGAKGFWIGITVGLTVSAILLGQHLYVLQKRYTSKCRENNQCV